MGFSLNTRRRRALTSEAEAINARCEAKYASGAQRGCWGDGYDTETAAKAVAIMIPLAILSTAAVLFFAWLCNPQRDKKDSWRDHIFR